MSPFPLNHDSLLFCFVFFSPKPELWNIYGKLLISLRIFKQSLGSIYEENLESRTHFNITSVSGPRKLTRAWICLFFPVGQTRTSVEAARKQTSLKEIKWNNIEIWYIITILQKVVIKERTCYRIFLKNTVEKKMIQIIEYICYWEEGLNDNMSIYKWIYAPYQC